MSRHNKDRRAAMRALEASGPNSAHVGGKPRPALPILSHHDIRKAPPGTQSSSFTPGGQLPLSAVSVAAMTHTEEPSGEVAPVVYTGQTRGMSDGWTNWEALPYYGTLRRYEDGFPIGGGPFAVIGITHVSEQAVHDWRDYQNIKNQICGPEWEAVELYPAESRHRDPSNRYYLWCVPLGVFNFGFVGRCVIPHGSGAAPQRPFPFDPATACATKNGG